MSLSHDLAPVLGAIHYERDFDINGTLRTVIKNLEVKGVKVGGVLQESEFRPNGCCAQLNIVDIRTGKTERVTQDRGRESRGCKLDPRGLAAISHCITDAIDVGVDLVIINKYGRAESEGDGLLSCIADALLAGVPMLTTVRDPYVAARNYRFSFQTRQCVGSMSMSFFVEASTQLFSLLRHGNTSAWIP